jgi:3-deoxy-D-manno-octulosonic-acid transferase
LSLLIYNLLLPFALLAMIPGALRKMRERGGSWSDLRQRIGLFDKPQRTALAALSHFDRRFWFHAVSVGEVGVALKLIAPLLEKEPATGAVLTTTTPTGHRIATDFAAKQNGRVAVLYSPLDLPPIVRHLLLEIAPHRLVLVEAEVWPNLVAQARRLNIPVSLANARLSHRSERQFRRFGFLTRPVFSQLDQVLVQEPADVARWANLGAVPSHIHLTGSVKYDPEGRNTVSPEQLTHFRSLLASLGIFPGTQRILIAASTHPDEELVLAKTYLSLLQHPESNLPETAFLIVPRHVERSPAIAKQLAAIGLDPILRSSLLPDTPPLPFSAQRPLLIDTTGELNAWQHLSDIVIIGKSFLAHGGQNPAEAALARKPVLFGPHMENFEPLIKLLLDAGGAIQVPDLSPLPNLLASLLRDPERAHTLGNAGHAALTRHAGATHRTLDHLTHFKHSSGAHLD